MNAIPQPREVRVEMMASRTGYTPVQQDPPSNRHALEAQKRKGAKADTTSQTREVTGKAYFKRAGEAKFEEMFGGQEVSFMWRPL